MTASPAFPPGRYGRRREARRTPRWVPVAVLIPVVLAALWLANRLYGQYGDPPYQPGTPSIEQVGDSSVTVTFTVRKRDAGPALCRLQAKDGSGTEVGYAEVPVGADPVRYTMVTTGRAGTVEVLGCRAG